MSELYLQTFLYNIVEPCCMFSADPTWLGVGKPPSGRNMFILKLLGGGWRHPQCTIKEKQMAPVAGHLKIRWDIVLDCVIDVTGSIKTLRITINFNWDKIA